MATLTPVGDAMANAIEDEPAVGAVWARQLSEQAHDVAPEPDANDVDFVEGAPNAQDRASDAAERAAADEAATYAPDEDEDDSERDQGHLDPRQAIADVLGRRLENVLQPVDDDDAWHGIFVITKRDLSAVLQQPLPEPNAGAAAVKASAWTPALIYVLALCPRCRQSVDVLVSLRPQLLVGTEAEIKVKAKTSAVPHVCGQTHVRDVTASRPEHQERLPLSSPVAPPADREDDAYVGAGTYRETVEPEREPTQLEEAQAAQAWHEADESDVRPTGEVNPELLAGEASRAIDDETDLDDLPF